MYANDQTYENKKIQEEYVKKEILKIKLKIDFEN